MLRRRPASQAIGGGSLARNVACSNLARPVPLATAVSTAGGLALLAFSRRALYAAFAVILIVVPHLYGAPQPADYAAAAPEALAHRFTVAATLVSFLFWAALGASTGYFYRRFERWAG